MQKLKCDKSIGHDALYQVGVCDEGLSQNLGEYFDLMYTGFLLSETDIGVPHFDCLEDENFPQNLNSNPKTG